MVFNWFLIVVDYFMFNVSLFSFREEDDADERNGSAWLARRRVSRLRCSYEADAEDYSRFIALPFLHISFIAVARVLVKTKF